MLTPDRPIIWLASYPKSGNTYLRLFLEAWFNDGRVRLNRAFEMMHAHRHAYTWQQAAPWPLNEMTPNAIAHLRPAFYAHMIANKRKVLIGGHTYLFLKNHSVYAGYEQTKIPLVPPGLTHKAIYIVRDPRDVALSLANHSGVSVPSTIEFMASEEFKLGADRDDNDIDALADPVSTWTLHVKTWTADRADNGPRFPVHVVKYEDLVADPVKRFQGILEFLGAWQGTDDNRSLLHRCVGATTFVNVQELERKTGYIYRPRTCEQFFAHGCSHWRDDMRPGHARRIEDTHGVMMERFGYERQELAEAGHATAL